MHKVECNWIDNIRCAALGRVANTRPVATIEKWATGRVMQRLALARSVGHGETGFRLRSSVFATPLVQYLMSYLFHSLEAPTNPISSIKTTNLYIFIYLFLFIYLFICIYFFWWLKHLRACYVGNQPCFFCACENVMLHWIGPVPQKRSTCLQNRSCICNAPLDSHPRWDTEVRY